MQDPISTLKLYPRKSNNLVTTSVNTQFHVAKELVDYISGFEISVDVYYDPAALSMSNYNAFCGRGNNSVSPSGMSLPGTSATSVFFGKWKDGPLSQISKTGLTADWYRYSMVVTATTCQIKLLNLRTNVELSGNVATVGTSTVGEDKNFTFLCYGIDGITGAYGSVGVNYSNIKILRGSTCLLYVPLSEGADTKVTDICNSSQYQLSFFTAASGWAKLSNYFHWNFRYGFTLYQKSGSPDIRIPNKKDGSEIILPAPPSGYTRVANYKECRLAFNNCENVFVLDNTTPGGDLYNADPDHVLFTEDTGVAKEFDLKTLDFNYDRGFLYINSDVQEKDFMLYRTDKTYSNDLRVIKYIEQDDRITYDEAGTPNHDESGHVELTE